MASKTEQLLALYREYEGLVRDAGYDVKFFEDGMDSVMGDRMRMVRQFRNYLSHHNDPGFLEPTDRMIAFLNKQLTDWKMRGDVVKKHVKSVSYSMCTDKDRCVDAIAKMAAMKRDKIVMMTGSGLVLVSMYDITPLAFTAKSAKMSVAKVLKEKPVFVGPLTDMAGLDKTHVHVCTDDGTPNGKVMGTVVF